MSVSYRIHPTYSPTRHAWLQRLADEGTAKRNSKTGHNCMVLGWTRWATYGERRTFGPERLTRAGRAVLAKWNAGKR